MLSWLPGAQADHARVVEMLSSPEMQRRLEEARVQRARVLAEREASRAAAQGLAPRPLASDGSCGASATETHPAELGADGLSPVPAEPRDTLPPMPTPAAPSAARPSAHPSVHPSGRTALLASAGPVGSGQARALDSAHATPPKRRQPWVLSLVIGLVAGLAIGTGLMLSLIHI